LNYAAGLTFPCPIDPPISRINLIFYFTSGKVLSNIAIFVIGPVISTIIGSFRSMKTFLIFQNTDYFIAF
jgi:hypothetical protein